MTCSCHAPIAPSSRWWDDSIKWIPGITGFKALKQTNLVLHWEFERWGCKTLFCMTLLLCSAQVSYTHLPLLAMTVKEISVPMDRYERSVQCYFLIIFQLVTVILFQLMKGLRKQITSKETNCIYSNGKIKQTIKKNVLTSRLRWLINSTFCFSAWWSFLVKSSTVSISEGFLCWGNCDSCISLPGLKNMNVFKKHEYSFQVLVLLYFNYPAMGPEI